jgi:hypothetical protein
MAYPSVGGKDNSLLIIGGAGVLGFLWYKGYLAQWFPSLFGGQAGASQQIIQDPTSIGSSSVVPSVSQIASPTIQTVSGGGGGMPPRRNVHTSITPNAQVVSTPNPDFANESYYTWRAAGQPMSVLAQMQAAFADEVQGLRTTSQTVAPSALLQSSPIPDIHLYPTEVPIPTPAPTVIDYSNHANWTVSNDGPQTKESMDILDLEWKNYSKAPIPIVNTPATPLSAYQAQSKISALTSANVSSVANTPTVANVATPAPPPVVTTIMHPVSGMTRR